MSLPVAIRTALLSNTTLNTLTGDRVYYMRFPQDSVLDAVVFIPRNNVQEAVYAGTSVLLYPEVRLTLRSASLATLEEMRQSIHDQFNVPEVAITGYGAVQCRIDDLGADYDDALDVYHHYITLNLSMRTN
jgi:hypothetical protein